MFLVKLKPCGRFGHVGLPPALHPPRAAVHPARTLLSPRLPDPQWKYLRSENTNTNKKTFGMGKQLSAQPTPSNKLIIL